MTIKIKLQVHFITENANNIILFNFRYADDVSLGDEVLVDATDGLTTATVLDSYSSVMQGDNLFIEMKQFFLFHQNDTEI